MDRAIKHGDSRIERKWRKSTRLKRFPLALSVSLACMLLMLYK